ncbi:MAG TPA: hypothetical protein VGQ17_08770 [Gemmatimonadales bacterium]|nr:hypothetical protein [Gemmatimonadales bacterium]
MAVTAATAAPSEAGAAISADPFRPDRRPAPVAFRMPGEPAGPGDSERASQPPPITLIGTAVQPDGGGFAMCQLGNDPPRLVRLGERLAGYTLRAVGQGRATFRSETGQALEVRVPKTGT